MQIKCAIVDDEPLAVGLLESYVSKTPQLELCGSYSNAIDAMKGLWEQPVDLVFLDIQMPEINGLELSRVIDSHHTRIVFTTAFSQYALEGYKVNALDYLLKPIAYADFMLAVHKAQQWLELINRAESSTDTDRAEVGETGRQLPEPAGNTTPTDTDESMFVKSDYKIIRVNFADIIYIEGLKNYVKIYLQNNPRPLLSITSMHAIESVLPATRFFRIHRSYIVNMSKVAVFERGQIVFGDKYLPVSDSYRSKVQNYISARLLQGR